MNRPNPPRSGPRRRGPSRGMLRWALAALALVCGLAVTTLLVRELGGDSAFAQAAGGRGDNPRAPRLNGISIEERDGGTVVQIRVDQPVDYRFFGLGDPTPRLVIDMTRVSFNLANRDAGTLSGRGLVRQIRYAHKSETESRVVLDLTGPVQVRQHALAGSGGGRTLTLTLGASTAQAFARLAPVTATNRAAASTEAPTPLRPGGRASRHVIVIDPGHGGRDPGAPGVSGGSHEKQVTLASGLVLRDILRAGNRYEVVMTRDTDVFLPLEERIVLARERNADLFISLHADAAPANSNVRGATVYTLSEEGGERSRRLLNNENWTIAPSNSTRDTRVTDILRDLTQRDTKNQSAEFAEMVLAELAPVGPLTGSSHRRAGFFVLLSPTVPAILLEMGFMTDAQDEARLRDPAFRQRQMQAVARAIDAYFREIDAQAAATTATGR